ncbi:MAG: lysine--tRNA ligase [Candidatus Cloacimonadota bacterium]|nr:lysine--tRNA ligase [Candidatus Cloacimonadota bacterium]
MQSIKQILGQRRKKYDDLIKLDKNPFPNRVKISHKIASLLENEKEFIKDETEISIAGRVNAKRRHGKSGFGNIIDESGKIQFFIRKDAVGEENYEVFKLTDLGDFISATGKMFYTKTGHYTLKISSFQIIGKSLRPLPTVKEKVVDGEKKRFDEFANIELRYRKRYLDLLLNPENKNIFVQRANIVRYMRDFFNENDFLEVETPILQSLYGGANARPFVTHHNTLSTDLYLRIATELHLKRLIVGGFEKVYEIGKNFRNEGMDKSHNPEFTAMEVYQAYADYNDMMTLTEDMISYIVKKLYNSNKIEFDGQEVSFKKPWRRATMIDLISEHTGFDTSDFDYEKIKKFCEDSNIEVEKNAGAGQLITELFDKFVEPNIVQPTFVMDFPKEVSPLAKTKPGNDKIVERFELFIAGEEFGNAFTELNDPIDQRKRLEAQAKLRELGDVEANVVDEDFIEALEYGMPPTGGLGIGIDRLVMLLTDNTSIKEVLLFPQMKPEE